jgi:hypothetical protein
MAKFLTTSGVSHEVENIVKEAKKKLVLISPYIQINKMLLERLKIASAKGVQITFIYGKTELNLIEKKQLESIENLKLYFYPNLHAKCYFNEKLMVITSMNLYAFSEKNNREMGILINKVDDIEVFNDAVEETLSIVKSAQKKSITRKGISVFPLKEEDFKTLDGLFEKEFRHSKINSTATYVFCTDLLPFANVMIREGFEIRLHQNLYSENQLVNKIKMLTFNNLNYEYSIELLVSKYGESKILIMSKNTFNLKTMFDDYVQIYLILLNETKRISCKRKILFM